MDREDQLELLASAVGKYGSVKSLAEKLGVQPLAVYSWKCGTRPMRPLVELAILELLHRRTR